MLGFYNTKVRVRRRKMLAHRPPRRIATTTPHAHYTAATVSTSRLNSFRLLWSIKAGMVAAVWRKRKIRVIVSMPLGVLKFMTRSPLLIITKSGRHLRYHDDVSCRSEFLVVLNRLERRNRHSLTSMTLLLCCFIVFLETKTQSVRKWQRREERRRFLWSTLPATRVSTRRRVVESKSPHLERPMVAQKHIFKIMASLIAFLPAIIRIIVFIACIPTMTDDEDYFYKRTFAGRLE